MGRNPKPIVAEDDDSNLEMRSVLRGVTISWLANVFRMDYNTCKKKLVNCPELGKGKGNAPIFDLPQAAAFLVKPKVDINAFVRSLRPADLPPYLQSEFWEAQNKRQKWEENAGELWRTEKVVEVFGETFKLMKDTMNLWVDALERKSGITGDQRKMLTSEVDALQDELHKRLVDMQVQKKTKPSLSELDTIENEVNHKEAMAPKDSPRKRLASELI